jgi:hypothetical protein
MHFLAVMAIILHVNSVSGALIDIKQEVIKVF